MSFGRLAIIMCCTLLLLPATVLATSARVNALGGGGEYFEDDYNVQRWYGSLVDYPDRVVLDTGHFNIFDGYQHPDAGRLSGPSGEIVVDLNRWKLPGVLSMALHAMGDDVDGSSLYRDRMRATVSLMYGFHIKGVATTLLYRHGSDSHSPGDHTFSYITPDTALVGAWTWDRSRSNLGLGLRFDLGDEAYMDLAGEIRFMDGDVRAEDFDPAPVPVPALPSKSIFDTHNLRARAFFRLGESTALVPVAEWTRDDREVYEDSFDYRYRIDGQALKLGTGLNYYPDPDHLVILSADYTHGSLDYSLFTTAPELNMTWSSQWNALRTRLALESVFLSWVTVRSGVAYDLILETVNGETWTKAGLALSLGVAIHAGAWDLDLSIDEVEPRAAGRYLGPLNRPADRNWLTLALRRQF